MALNIHLEPFPRVAAGRGPQSQWGGREREGLGETSKDGVWMGEGTRGGSRRIQLSEAKLEFSEEGSEQGNTPRSRASRKPKPKPPSLRGGGGRGWRLVKAKVVGNTGRATLGLATRWREHAWGRALCLGARHILARAHARYIEATRLRHR